MSVVETAAGDAEGIEGAAEVALPDPGERGGGSWWDSLRVGERAFCCEEFGVVEWRSEGGRERGPGWCAGGADVFVLAEAGIRRVEDGADVSHSDVFVGHGWGGCANGEGEERPVEVIQPC